MQKRGCIPIACTGRLRFGTDGPGIRTLIVTAQCPLRCKYCINPYTWNGDAVVKNETPEELFKRVRVDNLYFQATNGGVTFGGGEPLLWSCEIRKFVDQYCENWSVCVQTSLYVPWENVEQIVDVVDEFHIDIKSLDPVIYRNYTGQENDIVLDNLKRLLASVPKERIIVRVPEIPGYSSVEDCQRDVEALRSMGVERIDQFRYVTDV